MALGLRLVSICVVAGFYGAAATAHGETADLLRPTIAEGDAQVEPAEEPAVVPSLTIAPEEEQAPLKIDPANNRSLCSAGHEAGRNNPLSRA